MDVGESIDVSFNVQWGSIDSMKKDSVVSHGKDVFEDIGKSKDVILFQKQVCSNVATWGGWVCLFFKE